MTTSESPLLPNRTSSMKRFTTTTNSGHMTTQSLRREGERPFMAVKRAHEESRKYGTQSSSESAATLAANPMGHIVRSPSRGNDTVDSGLLSVVEQQNQARMGTGNSLVGTEANQNDALAELIASLATGDEKSDGSESTNTSSAWNTQV